MLQKRARQQVSVFSVPYRARNARPPKPVTLRNFSGGLNTVDSDEALTTKFAVSLRNMQIGTDGSLHLRFGTEYYVDVASVLGADIIDKVEFRKKVICVGTNGQVCTVDENGVVQLIWSAAIAAALLGSPSGWSTGLTRVDFVPFRDALIIHNGVDKPIKVSNSFAVTYLQDAATGSNVNTPIGLFGCVASNYHVIARLIGRPQTEIAISSRGTDGTFPSDPAPNDSLIIDIGAFVPSDIGEVRGIAGYRDKLLVFLEHDTLIMGLGVYEAAVHVPAFSDIMPHFGLLSHRCITPIENDIVFPGSSGVASAKRNLLAGLVESRPLSAIIRPTYVSTIRGLSDDEIILDTFTDHNEADGQVLTFTPDGVFSYVFDEQLKVKAWNMVDGWTWDCSCSTADKRMLFSDGTRIFKLSNLDDEGYADRAGDRDANWAFSTAYTVDQIIRDTVLNSSWKVLVNHSSPAIGTFEDYREANPTHWEEYLGEEIEFEWETPWIDFQDPERIKKISHIKVGSKGTASFRIDAYVDGLYKDEDGTVIHDPAIGIDLVGNDMLGAGADPSQPFGGGRKSNDPRLWKFPVRFKRIKFKLHGSTRRKLQIFSVTCLFSKGSYFRG